MFNTLSILLKGHRLWLYPCVALLAMITLAWYPPRPANLFLSEQLEQTEALLKQSGEWNQEIEEQLLPIYQSEREEQLLFTFHQNSGDLAQQLEKKRDYVRQLEAYPYFHDVISLVPEIEKTSLFYSYFSHQNIPIFNQELSYLIASNVIWVLSLNLGGIAFALLQFHLLESSRHHPSVLGVLFSNWKTKIRIYLYSILLCLLSQWLIAGIGIIVYCSLMDISISSIPVFYYSTQGLRVESLFLVLPSLLTIQFGSSILLALGIEFLHRLKCDLLIILIILSLLWLPLLMNLSVYPISIVRF